MGKEPLTTRLDADTKQEVENYADERDIGQTEAARRLIRSGLAAEGHAVTTTDGSGPTSHVERTKQTVFGWLERSVYAMVLLLSGTLIAGGSAVIYGTTPIPYLWLGLATFTAAVATILSAVMWFGLELYASSSTPTTTEAKA